MKGVLFPVDDPSKIGQVIESRTYGVTIEDPDGEEGDGWTEAGLQSLVEHVPLTEGDKVFFFADKRIYGVGELVAVGDGGPVFRNFEESLRSDSIESTREEALFPPDTLEFEDWREVRLLLTFEPSPAFYEHGVEMDDLLSSKRHIPSFPYLRAFDTRNFTLLGSEETRNLIECFMRNFDAESERQQPENQQWTEPFETATEFEISDCGDISTLVGRDESWLHGFIMEYLRESDAGDDGPTWTPTDSITDEYELFREYPASPPKPTGQSRSQIEEIDILQQVHPSDETYAVGGYHVIEVKPGRLTKAPFVDMVLQVIAYAAYIQRMYTVGDFGPVSASIIGGGFEHRNAGYVEEFLDAPDDFEHSPEDRGRDWRRIPRTVRRTIEESDEGLERILDAISLSVVEYELEGEEPFELSHVASTGE